MYIKKIIVFLIVIIIIAGTIIIIKNTTKPNEIIPINISEEVIEEAEEFVEASNYCEAIKQVNPNLCADFDKLASLNNISQKNIEISCISTILKKKMILEQKNYCQDMPNANDSQKLNICNDVFSKIINPELAQKEDERRFFEILNSKQLSGCEELKDTRYESIINLTGVSYYTCIKFFDANIEC